jgi:predicted CXXCH cytochrome family protein
MCLKCHPAERGPFVFEHQALREGCTTCHNPHGSINAKLLVDRDANLCLRCHFEQYTGSQILIGGSDHTRRLRKAPAGRPVAMRPCTARASTRTWDFKRSHCYEYTNKNPAKEMVRSLCRFTLGVTGGVWRGGARGGHEQPADGAAGLF